MSPGGAPRRFTLPSASGRDVSLADLSGQYVVLCFYPSTWTAESAQEAQAFQALLPEFAALEACVMGVSPDGPPRLARFCAENRLQFTVLADQDHAVARAYGTATGEGRTQRVTVLLDRVGTVRWAWPRVKVDGHAEEVLSALRALRAADSEIVPLIQARRAYRALAEEEVPREALERLIEAAHLAPSCSNNQPWRFVVATGKTLEAVKAALSGGNYWAKRAPAILALCSRRDLDCVLSDSRDYFLFGCGMATGLLMIQATQMGLVAHPIAGYDPLAVKEALRIPQEYVLITLIVVGKRGDASGLSDKHRGVERGPRERNPLSTVLMWDTFSQPDPTEDS